MAAARGCTASRKLFVSAQEMVGRGQESLRLGQEDKASGLETYQSLK